jgi:drug/metabolite transporter (DMT)-like permease
LEAATVDAPKRKFKVMHCPVVSKGMDSTGRPHAPTIEAPAAHHRLGILLILVSTIAWSSAGLFVRLLPFDVWTIIVWRGVFGLLFIGCFVFWRFGWSTFSLIGKLGIAGITVTLCSTAAITLFPAAFQTTSVANATTILASIPFVTAAIAWVWLRERPSIPTLIASAIALTGIIIMLGPSAGGPRLGDFLAFLATFAMALLTVIIRSRRHIEMLPVAMLSILLSSLIALPFAQHLGDLGPRDYLVAAGFGLFPMTLGPDALRHWLGDDPFDAYRPDRHDRGAHCRIAGLGGRG